MLNYETIPEDASEIFQEIETQTDRSAAIIAATFVETTLRAAIETEWNIPSNSVRERIFKGYAPLSSFSAKIEIGSVIGLFGPKTHGDLNLIRKIRNEFAHFLNPLSFKTPHVERLCEQLQLRKEMAVPDGSEVNRYRFVEACKTIIFVFSIRVEELEHPSRDRSAPRPSLPTLP
jgi:hypothetical protein